MGCSHTGVVEGVGVEVVVGDALDAAELLAVHAVEAVGEGFGRCGVHGVMVAFGLAPLLAQFAHALDDGQRELLALRVPAVVADPVLAVEDGGGLGQADVAERHGGALVLEQRVDVAARAEATEGAKRNRVGALTGVACLQRMMRNCSAWWATSMRSLNSFQKRSLLPWDSMAMRGTFTETTPRFMRPSSSSLPVSGLIQPCRKERQPIGALKEPVILTMFS